MCRKGLSYRALLIVFRQKNWENKNEHKKDI